MGVTVSTEAARNEMRVAQKYIDEAEQMLDDKKNHDLVAANQKFINALKCLEKARSLDPAVTLQVKLRSGEIGLRTPDILEADVLFQQANSVDRFDQNPQSVQSAIHKLQRAISLEPRLSTAYAVLAQYYITAHSRKEAVALLQDASSKFPDDFRIRSFVDKLQEETTKARTELQFAAKYVQEFHRLSDKKTKDIQRAHEQLEHALKYVTKIRAIDPHVTAEIQTGSDKTRLVSVDSLEGEILFYRGSYIQPEHSTEEHRRIVIPRLERAIELNPDISVFYAFLARMYMADTNRDTAIALLQRAKAKFTDDFDIRSTLDEIESKPSWGKNPDTDDSALG